MLRNFCMFFERLPLSGSAAIVVLVTADHTNVILA